MMADSKRVIDERTREAWLQDLGANPKKQEGSLGNADEGHCCLGRLCVVAGQHLDNEYVQGSSLRGKEVPDIGLDGTLGAINGTDFSLADVNDGTTRAANGLKYGDLVGELPKDHAEMASFIRNNAGFIFSDLEPGDTLPYRELSSFDD